MASALRESIGSLVSSLRRTDPGDEAVRRSRQGKRAFKRIGAILEAEPDGWAAGLAAFDYLLRSERDPLWSKRILRAFSAPDVPEILGLIICDACSVTFDAAESDEAEATARARHILLRLSQRLTQDAVEVPDFLQGPVDRQIAPLLKKRRDFTARWTTLGLFLLLERATPLDTPLDAFSSSHLRKLVLAELSQALPIMYREAPESVAGPARALARLSSRRECVDYHAAYFDARRQGLAAIFAEQAFLCFREENPLICHKIVRSYLGKNGTDVRAVEALFTYVLFFGTSTVQGRAAVKRLQLTAFSERLEDLVTSGGQARGRLLTAEGAVGLLELACGRVSNEIGRGLVDLVATRPEIYTIGWREAARLGRLYGDFFNLDLALERDLIAASQAVPESFAGKVVVLAEPGGDLSSIDSDPRFSSAELVLYALQDCSKFFVNKTVTFGSYRDKIPDHSDTSRKLYSEAQAFSQSCADAIFEALDPEAQDSFVPYFDALALACEDNVALALTNMECFDACLAEVPEAEAVVIALNSGEQLGPIISYLFRERPRRNVFIKLVGDERAREPLVSRLFLEFLAAPGVSLDANAPGLDLEAEGPWGGLLGSIDAMVSGSAKSRAYAAAKDYVLLGGHLGQFNYRATTVEIAEALVARDCDVLLYDSAHRLFEREAANAKEEILFSPRLDVIDLNWLGGLVRRADIRERSAKLVNAVGLPQFELTRYDRPEVRAFLFNVFRRFVRAELFETLVRAQYWRAFFRHTTPRAFVVSTTRVVSLRLAAIAARLEGVPVVDVQALNILPHPKYKKPLCDIALVIDDFSARIHREYLGLSGEKIVVTGTPRVDAIRAETLALKAELIEHEIGLDPKHCPRVAFASQLQPLERCLSILRQLCRAAVAADSELIVKLHPREGDARVQAYERMIRDEGAEHLTHIVHRVPIQKVLAVAEVVVTMFSNVAREALLVGHDVIIANYFDEDLPLRFDQEGVAEGAYSEAELFERVVAAIERRRAPEGERRLNEYLTRNAHLLDGKSAERIADVTQRQAGPSGATPAFPALTDEELAFTPVAELVRLLECSFGETGENAYRFREALIEDATRFVARGGLSSVRLVCREDDPEGADVPDFIRRLVLAVDDQETLREAAAACAVTWDMGERRLLATLENLLDVDALGPRIFVAECFAAAGLPIRASRAFRLAADVSTDGPLAERLLETASALMPRRAFAGTAEVDLDRLCDVAGLTVVVERGVDPRAVQELAEVLPVRRIVAEDPASTELLIDEHIKKRYFREISGDQSAEFANLLKTSPEAFAEDFHKALVQVLGGSALGRLVERHHAAVFAWMRAALVDQTRRSFECNRAASEAGADDFIVLGHTVRFAETFMSSLDRAVFVFGGTQARERKAWSEALSALPEKEMAVAGPVGELGKIVEQINETIYGTPPLDLPGTDRDRVLLVGRWSLKTIPATVTPLLRKKPAEISVTMIAAGTAEGDAEPAGTFRRLREEAGEESLYLVPKDAFGANIPDVEVTRSLRDAVWQACGESPALRELGLDMRMAAFKRVSLFTVNVLYYLVNLDRAVRRFLSAEGRAIVAVSPGRHAEALVVQDVARDCGKISVDIQNAYMAASYTYTKPYGDLVTAIDQWSVDLFADHFGVPREALRKIGTPRFDQIADAVSEIEETGNGRLTAIDLGFADPDLPLVCFATQPGQVDANIAITRLLSEIGSETAINVVVKLHPNDPDSESTYLRLMGDLAAAGRCVAIRSYPIYPIIAASEVMVTIFSNVGLEAAIAGRNLLVVNFSGTSMPLPLDEFHIGYNAYDDEQFKAGLLGLLFDQGVREEVEAKRAAYFRVNRHLKVGNSTDEIWKLMLEEMR